MVSVITLVEMKSIFCLLFVLLFVELVIAQNGKILDKQLVDLSKTEVWYRISENNILKDEFAHLNNLDFFFITYQSDSLVINGILIEPKSSGKYPVVIFNRGGNRDFAPLNLSTIINYTSRNLETIQCLLGLQIIQC